MRQDSYNHGGGVDDVEDDQVDLGDSEPTIEPCAESIVEADQWIRIDVSGDYWYEHKATGNTAWELPPGAILVADDEMN